MYLVDYGFEGFDGGGGLGVDVASDFVESELSEFEDVVGNLFGGSRYRLGHGLVVDGHPVGVETFRHHGEDVEGSLESRGITALVDTCLVELV